MHESPALILQTTFVLLVLFFRCCSAGGVHGTAGGFKVYLVLSCGYYVIHRGVVALAAVVWRKP